MSNTNKDIDVPRAVISIIVGVAFRIEALGYPLWREITARIVDKATRLLYQITCTHGYVTAPLRSKGALVVQHGWKMYRANADIDAPVGVILTIAKNATLHAAAL